VGVYAFTGEGQGTRFSGCHPEFLSSQPTADQSHARMRYPTGRDACGTGKILPPIQMWRGGQDTPLLYSLHYFLRTGWKTRRSASRAGTLTVYVNREACCGGNSMDLSGEICSTFNLEIPRMRPAATLGGTER